MSRRVALFGDIGGHAELWSEKLVELGCDPETGFIPDDLFVIQVGDLVHRGPDDVGCLLIAQRFLEVSSDRYIQLAGNHEGSELGLSTFSGFERIPHEWALTLREWAETGQMRMAVALTSTTPGLEGEILVTHAGLAPFTWMSLVPESYVPDRLPYSAYETADRLNHMLLADPHRAFRAGVMLGDDDSPRTAPPDPGVAWAHSTAEVTYPWMQAGQTPFHQIHGHSSLFNWRSGKFSRATLPEMQEFVRVDRKNRHTFTTVGDRTFVGIDPSHSTYGAVTWGPLVLDLAD